MKKKIGIIGGMGPLATCDLMQKMVMVTDAKTDQEFPHIYVDCNTDIPDRTACILHGGESPLPQMQKSAQDLARLGAQVLCMPCNTAHFFHGELQKQIVVPIVHMIEETMKFARGNGYRKAGLLATTATIQSGLYGKYAAAHGVELVLPEEAEQAVIMGVIYQGVKASNWAYDTQEFARVLRHMEQKGAGCFILGCTELPIAFQRYQIAGETIDPTLILARAVVADAGFPLVKYR